MASLVTAFAAWSAPLGGLPVCDRCEVRPVEQEIVCFEAKERSKAGGGKSWVIRRLLEHHLRWNGDPPTHQCPAGLSRNRYGATSRLQMLQPLQVYQMGVVLDGVQPEHPSTSRRPHRLGRRSLPRARKRARALCQRRAGSAQVPSRRRPRSLF